MAKRTGASLLPTREERAMAKRLEDSRKAEAEYERTLDPRQRAGAEQAATA